MSDESIQHSTFPSPVFVVIAIVALLTFAKRFAEGVRLMRTIVEGFCARR